MTELEMITIDWLAELVGLPSSWRNSASGHSAGMIQGTASEATLVALLCARKIGADRVVRAYVIRPGTRLRYPLYKKVQSLTT
jgi:glutamate/tyrosine decarboxylase-like PLP-dependent enzyme